LYPSGSIFPDDWLIVPRNIIDILRPEMAGNYSFLMVIDEDGNLNKQQLLSNGIYTRPTSGVVNFFESGIFQVEDDLWTIVLITGIVITLLVYSIISIETEYNAPTIKIIRGIGATRKYVIQIFLMKACFITLVGGIVGAAMGFCAASAIASISSVLGIMTFITPSAGINSILLPLVIAVVSGLIGGLWPAIRASRLFTSQRREDQ
jgi:putative ABC transport system permease protein